MIEREKGSRKRPGKVDDEVGGWEGEILER